MHSTAHIPVLLEETIAAWFSRPDGIYIDGTFGRGGHSTALLERLDPQASLLAIDRDPLAIDAAHQLRRSFPQLQVEQDGFANMLRYVEARGWTGRVDGILLDLGMSSPQLDSAERGFSFMRHGPLDMRMNPEQGQSAAQWLATAAWEEIVEVLAVYGEEKFAKQIAREIERSRERSPIVTTTDLVDLVLRAVPAKDQGKHKATRTFQAIRIHINQELEQLKTVLANSFSMLSSGGKLAIISFHSLEDRIVKRFMRDRAAGQQVPKSVPLSIAQMQPASAQVMRAVKPSADELRDNPRSRSAILRVIEKL